MNAHQAKYAERAWDQYANVYFERNPYPSATGIKTVPESFAKEKPQAKGDHQVDIVYEKEIS
jgi:hypothetical protein